MEWGRGFREAGHCERGACTILHINDVSMASGYHTHSLHCPHVCLPPPAVCPCAAAAAPPPCIRAAVHPLGRHHTGCPVSPRCNLTLQSPGSSSGGAEGGRGVTRKGSPAAAAAAAAAAAWAAALCNRHVYSEWQVTVLLHTPAGGTDE
jgi:hypothetical protein